MDQGACNTHEARNDLPSDLENNLLPYLKSIIRVHSNLVFSICLLIEVNLVDRRDKLV